MLTILPIGTSSAVWMCCAVSTSCMIRLTSRIFQSVHLLNIVLLLLTDVFCTVIVSFHYPTLYLSCESTNVLKACVFKCAVIFNSLCNVNILFLCFPFSGSFSFCSSFYCFCSFFNSLVLSSLLYFFL